MSGSPADDHTTLVAAAGGRAAAREMLLMLGMDVSTPEGIKQAQRDFIFLRDLRVGTAAVKHRIAFTLIGAVVTALLAYAALWFRVSPHN